LRSLDETEDLFQNGQQHIYNILESCFHYILHMEFPYRHINVQLSEEQQEMLDGEILNLLNQFKRISLERHGVNQTIGDDDNDDD
jgi:hypothetical protein